MKVGRRLREKVRRKKQKLIEELEKRIERKSNGERLVENDRMEKQTLVEDLEKPLDEKAKVVGKFLEIYEGKSNSEKYLEMIKRAKVEGKFRKFQKRKEKIYRIVKKKLRRDKRVG